MRADCNLEEWGFGPLFEVHIAFRDPILSTVASPRFQALLRCLNIEGPWQRPAEVGRTPPNAIDWPSMAVTYGRWHLSQEHALGVIVVPDTTSKAQMLLGCPPAQVEQQFGPYPWYVAPGWVTGSIVTLHRLVVNTCLALHREFGLRAVLLQDEAWLFSLSNTSRGVFLHPDVAEAGGFAGNRLNELFVVSLTD